MYLLILQVVTNIRYCWPIKTPNTNKEEIRIKDYNQCLKNTEINYYSNINYKYRLNSNYKQLILTYASYHSVHNF